MFKLSNYNYKVSESLNGARPGVLGVLEGQHFVPNGHSRNEGRFYPEQLWINCLASSDVVRKLTDRVMFGRIGHEEELTEVEIGEGKASHITTDLQMVGPDGTPGWGRTEILDTPAGQILHAYLKAGCNLYVSSRADGVYIKGKKQTHPETGKECPIMDPDNYLLERFDIVIEPGFLEANPKVVESLTSEALKVYESLVKKKGESMHKKPEGDLSQYEALLDQIATLQTQYEALKSKVESSDDNGSNDNVKDQLKEYEAFFDKYGSMDTIAQALEAMDDTLDGVDNVEEALARLKKFEELADEPEQLKTTLDLINDLTIELGSPAEISEKLKKTRESRRAYRYKSEELEDQVDDLKKECDDMKSENLRLKKRIEKLEDDLEYAKQEASNSDELEKFKDRVDTLELAEELNIDSDAIDEMKREGLTRNLIISHVNRMKTTESANVLKARPSVQPDPIAQKSRMGESLIGRTIRNFTGPVRKV